MSIDKIKIDSATESAIKEQIFDKVDIWKECIDEEIEKLFPNNPSVKKLIYTIFINSAKRWSEKLEIEG